MSNWPSTGAGAAFCIFEYGQVFNRVFTLCSGGPVSAVGPHHHHSHRMNNPQSMEQHRMIGGPLTRHATPLERLRTSVLDKLKENGIDEFNELGAQEKMRCANKNCIEADEETEENCLDCKVSLKSENDTGYTSPGEETLCDTLSLGSKNGTVNRGFLTVINKFYVYSKLKFNRFQHKIKFAIEHTFFEWFVIVVIIISSMTLVLENREYQEYQKCFELYGEKLNHLNKPHCNEDASLFSHKKIKLLDQFFTVIFTLEMLLKWTGLGLKKYFGNPWCLLDFSIVLVALASLTLEDRMSHTSMMDVDVSASDKGQTIKILRVLRSFRALRPLRAMSRFEGIKVVTDALVRSIPSIFNVMLILLVFWLVFAIIATNVFEGKFYRCVWTNFTWNKYHDGVIHMQGRLWHTCDLLKPAPNSTIKLRLEMTEEKLSVLSQNWWNFMKDGLLHGVKNNTDTENGDYLTSNEWHCERKFSVNFADYGRTASDFYLLNDHGEVVCNSYINGYFEKNYDIYEPDNEKDMKKCINKFYDMTIITRDECLLMNNDTTEVFYNGSSKIVPSWKALNESLWREKHGIYENTTGLSFMDLNGNTTRWKNLWFTFDNALHAYASLFQVATFKGWIPIMEAAVDMNGYHVQPRWENNFSFYYFFVAFIIFGAFFTLNLFISVVIDNFNDQKRKFDCSDGELLLSDAQREIHRTLKKFRKSTPTRLLKAPRESWFRGKIYTVVSSKEFELVALGVTISNLLLMAVENTLAPTTMDTLNIIYARDLKKTIFEKTSFD